jgi:hypothetical protein
VEKIMKRYCLILVFGLMLASASIATVGCNTPKAPDTTQADERRKEDSFGKTTEERQSNIKPGIAE